MVYVVQVGKYTRRGDFNVLTTRFVEMGKDVDARSFFLDQYRGFDVRVEAVEKIEKMDNPKEDTAQAATKPHGEPVVKKTRLYSILDKRLNFRTDEFKALTDCYFTTKSEYESAKEALEDAIRAHMEKLPMVDYVSGITIYRDHADIREIRLKGEGIELIDMLSFDPDTTAQE